MSGFARMVSYRVKKVFAWVLALLIIGLLIAGTFYVMTAL